MPQDCNSANNIYNPGAFQEQTRFVIEMPQDCRFPTNICNPGTFL
jgi:hypothetical protein